MNGPAVHSRSVRHVASSGKSPAVGASSLIGGSPPLPRHGLRDWNDPDGAQENSCAQKKSISDAAAALVDFDLLAGWGEDKLAINVIRKTRPYGVMTVNAGHSALPAVLSFLLNFVRDCPDGLSRY